MLFGETILYRAETRRTLARKKRFSGSLDYRMSKRQTYSFTRDAYSYARKKKTKIKLKNILTTLLYTIKYLFLHKICCYDKRTIPKRSVCIWIYPVAS